MTRKINEDSQILVKVLERAKELRKLQPDLRPLAVFDLDSTLFDVSPRIQQILADYVQVKAHQARFPKEIEKVKLARLETTDWGIKNALQRAGLDGVHPEFEKSIRGFWREHFFSDFYLRYDQPYPGAVAFVQGLAHLGCRIVYLTGRDVKRMGKGTLQGLQEWGFPTPNEHTELVLKPEAGMDDAQFKCDYFASQGFGKHPHIWFFENEPVNVNRVREAHDQVEIIFFQSTHSGRETVSSDLPRILHYLLEAENATDLQTSSLPGGNR